MGTKKTQEEPKAQPQLPPQNVNITTQNHRNLDQGKKKKNCC